MKVSRFQELVREEIINRLRETTQQISPEIIQSMREWIKDNQWGDLDDDEIDELSDQEIINGVKRHYEGGVNQFIKDSNLYETTIVDKTTDPNKAMDIARRDKKDINTVKSAIAQARTTGKAINIDEGFSSKYEIESKVINFLKEKGVIQSINGRELFFPSNIYEQIQKHNSLFKQFFISLYPLEDKARANKILSVLKLAFDVNNNSTIKGKKYFTIKGIPTSSGGFIIDDKNVKK